MSRKDIADSTMAEYPHHTFVNSDSQDYSPHFSHSDCGLCGGLPGDRYNVTAVIIGFPHSGADDTTQHHFEVCQDCMYYVAYGEGPDDYMGDDTDLTTFNGRLHNASDVDDKCDGYKSIGG